MTTREHLLAIAAEECMKIALEASLLAQRFSKALRFGLEETQPDQPDDNWTRIVAAYEKMLREGDDLHAVMAMLDIVTIYRSSRDVDALREKQEKVKRFLQHSSKCGTLTDDVVRDLRSAAMVIGQSSVEGETPAGRLRRAIDSTKAMNVLPLTAEECAKILDSTPGLSRHEAEQAFAERCTQWADRLEGKEHHG